MRSPFTKRREQAIADAKQSFEQALGDAQERMSQVLQGTVGDYEKRLAAAQAKAVELEAVVAALLDTFNRNKTIKVESDAYAYGIGEDGFDTYQLVRVDRIEDAKNAWARYLRRDGRDPEAMDVKAVEAAMIERHPELRDFISGARPNTHRREGGSILD